MIQQFLNHLQPLIKEMRMIINDIPVV